MPRTDPSGIRSCKYGGCGEHWQARRRGSGGGNSPGAATMAVPMKIDPDEFRVRPGEKVRLKKWPTRVRPYYASDEQYQKRLAEQVEQLSSLQSLLYASNRHAFLLIFQGMDAAGKDGVIKHVMSGINPQGCQVFSFKHPSAEELQHDFLW